MGNAWAALGARETRWRGATCHGSSTLARKRLESTPEGVRRIDTLRRVYQGDLTPAAESALDEIRRLGLEGSAADATRLEALRERERLNPPDDSEKARPPEPQIVRIVCSDGLV